MNIQIGSNRKIDPSRRRATTLFKPDGTPLDNDRVEIGPTDLAFTEWAALGITPPDMPRLRDYRLSRIIGQLQRRELAGLLTFDPLNIRYITDSTNMQLWTTHNPARACFVSADGYVVLWDFHGSEHLTAHLPLIREVRHGASFFYFESAGLVDQHAAHFAAEIDDLMRAHSGTNRRLAVDRMERAGHLALETLGIEITNGQEVTEFARVIKDANEVNAMRCAIAACESAMHEMEAMVRPGITEVDAWAILQHGNHIRGGEWIETRILSSGPRTNPWFQEAGPRVMAEGDILAFDTDLIGPYGYCADLSRTFLVGDGEPTAYEKQIYRDAHDHIMTNMALLRPGLTIDELTDLAQPLPEKYAAQRYGVVYHGVGLCDEYPSVRYPQDWEAGMHDTVLEPGMTLCVEVYYGEVGGPCGIKLEDQVLITEDGYENLTRYPFDNRFLT